MTATVSDARPPGVVVRLLNPILSTLVRTPIGRMITPLALLEFTGRHSNTAYRVVVAWHHLDTTPIVLTPAGWRANFTDTTPATIRWQGRRHELLGTLDSNPDNVAAAIDTMLANGTSPRSLALRIPAGHIVNRDDVIAIRRALIRFHPPSTAPTKRTDPAAATVATTSPDAFARP